MFFFHCVSASVAALSAVLAPCIHSISHLKSPSQTGKRGKKTQQQSTVDFFCANLCERAPTLCSIALKSSKKMKTAPFCAERFSRSIICRHCFVTPFADASPVIPIMLQWERAAPSCAAVKPPPLIAVSLLAAGRIPLCQTTAGEGNMMRRPRTSEPSNLHR